MLLTHCVMLSVLGLCLPARAAVTVVQPYRVLSSNATATVRCWIQPQPAYHQSQSPEEQSPPYPYPDPEVFRVALLRSPHGSQELCSSVINVTGQRVTDVKAEGEVQCTARVQAGAVEVTVSGLKPSHTDIYRCNIEIFYPPPFLRLTGNGTLIHVPDSCPQRGAEAQVAQHSDGAEEAERDGTLSLPVVVLVMLIIFVLIAIVYLQSLQCRRGRREVIGAVPVGAHKVEAVAVSYGNIA
ncbi:T-cell-specific surface glycoprotein CD28 homolog [Betta splendens]|uniref:T-cell-specific surface glycoprotein CD28 homolog n=1 Tax=Betta splendens TaxID=158456 RepID=A0A6P7LEN7_BETSP|nr:T-cell-specific surface glycoprotein CD28 homolog [Betta splendens]XP_028992666.1 T-cell-specific surface glycoprotein CD28 homolog [Betta splendens]